MASYCEENDFDTDTGHTGTGDKTLHQSLIPTTMGTVHLLPGITLLQPQTNLNDPPTNWLNQNPKFHQHLYNFIWQRSHPMHSSIGLASNYPHLTGDVDVISNAKNIKKLLKIPYSDSGSHISMMVHRIGKTLLIDEFDIHKHLLRQQKDDWNWLRDFYFEYIKKDLQMKCVPKKNKSRDNLQNRNMLSKFLYRSILAASPEERNNSALNRVSDSGPRMNDFHQRGVLWTFEDLRMFIGTDLPIFSGDNNYPCISLRLRDMDTPINVLTGLDYWLDNLMCNVPEVAMCFHMNGIVQKYEMIKTDDIPHMQNSKFNPEMVTDIARNILSFLKSNATKEGHTYWLYKGADEDVVKLYDLTSLADDSDSQAAENPFTVPLGMLLYKVARNLWQRKRKRATIKMLLETCLALLDENTHSQVCTSARFLLSDILISDRVVDENSDFEEEEEDEKEEDNEEWENSEESKISTVDVKALCVKSNYHKYHENHPLKLSTQESSLKYKEATHHIAMGLQCLDRDFTIQIRKQKNKVEEQVPCNKDQAIPLHYEPLKKSAPPHDTAEYPLHDKEHVQLAESDTSHSWHRLSKVLLLRKATIAFTAIAKKEIANKNVGICLKNVQLALTCFGGIRALLPTKALENSDLLSALLTIAGDAHLSFVHQNLQVADIIKDQEDLNEEEMDIIDSVKQELEIFEHTWVCEVSLEMEKNLVKICKCYQEALGLAKKYHTEEVITLTKRYGNIKNELGVWYMNQAQSCLQKEEFSLPNELMESLLKKSLVCFLEGIETFEKVSDSINSALLLCNKGRLMRLYAQAYTQSSSGSEFSSQERIYYKKASESYQLALAKLQHRDGYPDIWDSIYWELSTTYFNMAMLLQDYAPLSQQAKDEVEKEVTDLMNKSLKYCNTESSTMRQPMYLYRAATINHRLASLYHNSYRNELGEQRRKYLRQLAESHYIRSSSEFRNIECYMELLRTTLEQVALHEFTLSVQTGTKSRLRTLTAAIGCLISCSSTLTQMSKLSDDEDFREKIKSEGESLTEILESRLRFLLLQLVKNYKDYKKSKVSQGDLQNVKKLYSDSLKSDIQDSSVIDKVLKKWTHLVQLLEELKIFYQTVLLHEPG